MSTYPSAPIDEDTQGTLDLLNLDPGHHVDRQIILDAIETVAADGGGLIDPNELRGHLYGRVEPKVIGATIQGLARRGHIEPAGWTTTQGSASGNNGRPARVWRRVA